MKTLSTVLRKWHFWLAFTIVMLIETICLLGVRKIIVDLNCPEPEVLRKYASALMREEYDKIPIWLYRGAEFAIVDENVEQVLYSSSRFVSDNLVVSKCWAVPDIDEPYGERIKKAYIMYGNSIPDITKHYLQGEFAEGVSIASFWFITDELMPRKLLFVYPKQNVTDVRAIEQQSLLLLLFLPATAALGLLIGVKDAEVKNREREERERVEMISLLSHDIKTPLTVASGYISGVIDGIYSEEKERTVLLKAKNSLLRVQNLLLELGMFVNTEHPGFCSDMVVTDVNEFVRQFILVNTKRLVEKQFSVEADIPETSYYAIISQNEFTHLLENLLSNAEKYTPIGSTLYYSIYADKKKIQIFVGDNGPGLPENIRKRLFIPFSVGDSSNKQISMGLGLYFCKRIIEKHKGTMRYQDDCGTNKHHFIIEIPRARI